MPFLSHYHPSVGVFARNLLAREKGLPKPDLANHTLMHFLDKFVYRNPKAEDAKRGGSIMQPILGSGSASHLVGSGKAGARQQTIVNSSAFWNLKPDQVSAEDVFFHEYFARIGKPGEATPSKKPVDDQVPSGDEEAEDEIWDALVNSQPDLEEAAAEDSDLDLEDYDYSDNDTEVSAPGGANDLMSDVESATSAADAGFEGIFDESEEDDGPNSSGDEVVRQPQAGMKKAEHGGKSRPRRKELRSLPTFASADDYAEMLAAEDDNLDD